MRLEGVRRWSGVNWFLLVAPVLAVVGLLVARTVPWGTDDSGFEAVLLFDACVSVPVLYVLCYGRTMSVGQLAVRSLALACLGICLLGQVVPADAQSLLPRFGWARWIGIAVLLLIELRLLVAGIRLVFEGETTAHELQEKTGAPPLLARLMLLEARFWKAVWRFLRRR